MKKLMLLIFLSVNLTGCEKQKNVASPETSLPVTNQTESVEYSAAVGDLDNVQINQLYRNGTYQEQGMFVIENTQLKVYKIYAIPNPNQSPEELAVEQEKLVAELGLETFDDFEELVDSTYENCVIEVNGSKYFVEADGYSETFEKVAHNRIRDQKGVEYEVLK